MSIVILSEHEASQVSAGLSTKDKKLIGFVIGGAIGCLAVVFTNATIIRLGIFQDKVNPFALPREIPSFVYAGA